MTIELTERSEKLLEEFMARHPERSAPEIIEKVLLDAAGNERTCGTMTPQEAVDDIRELRKGVTLGGLKIKDLINEGRRY